MMFSSVVAEVAVYETSDKFDETDTVKDEDKRQDDSRSVAAAGSIT